MAAGKDETTINMAEFRRNIKVSLLMEQPAGYVGYGEGGVLTRPSVADRMAWCYWTRWRKAHSGVQDVFFSVFDEETWKDGEAAISTSRTPSSS